MFSFGHLKYVTTNAIPSIPVADDKPDYPVLIFLEAANGFRQMNTFQSPLFYWLGAAGPIDEQPAFSIVNAYSLVSLDRHLKGQPGALFNGPTGRYPEVFF